MIEISNLTIRYFDKKIISDVSLKLKDGEIMGLTGPSGAGKTTLLKSIMSLNNHKLKITRGQIKVDGIDITHMNFKEMRKYLGTLIGYIPQSPMTSFFPYKTIEVQLTNNISNRMNISKSQAKSMILESIKSVNFEDPARVLKSYPRELSGGMLQRLFIVNILVMKPKIILADEPTSALDQFNKNILLDYLLDLKKESSILFVSHDIDSIKKICDSVSVILEGSVVFNEDIQNIKKNRKKAVSHG